MKIHRNNRKSSRIRHDDPDTLAAYLRAVKAAFQSNSERENSENSCKYDHIVKLINDFRAGRIHIRTVKVEVKELLYGHNDLILGFNAFLPKKYPITLSVESLRFHDLAKGKKVKKVEENRELPWDVLDIISKTLDFDDLFQFAGVCKNWRAFHKIYWRIFLASQEPLLLQISYPKETLSFISIPNQKVYCLKMVRDIFRSHYVTSSSGYLIMVEYTTKKFLLINPFTRIKKVINAPTSESQSFLTNRVVLAFGKCSEEFVLVVLCKHCVHVYQSRNCGWVTYSTIGNPGRIVDFVVLHNMIYVVTDTVNIGVLSLNSSNIKFLKLRNTPNETYSLDLRLVTCYEQLLVVDLEFKEIKNVFKVDFSTMSYVKLETLGDMTLFCVSNGTQIKCYALTNPNMWGYESNYVYVSDIFSTICSVYSENDKILQNFITLPASLGTSSHTIDWCFRHLQYEVDYSLVE